MSDLHIWAGLLLGWLLYAVFLTGSVSYFRDEISAWMRPDVPAQEAPADPVQVTGRMIGWLAERAPQAPQWGISLPSARSPGVNLFWLGDGPRRFMERRLDPRTGEPLSRRETLGGEVFYRFHFNLHYMSPITGRWIVGVAAMFMLVAIISGIITHKKIFAEFFTFRWGKGQRSWLDAHNGLAVLGLPFHLMITWSGLVTLMMLYMPWGALTAFPTRADQMRQQQVITGFRLPAPRSGHAAPLGDVPAMVAQARDRWGAQGVGRVYVNNPGEAQARVIVLRSIEGQVSVSPQYLVFDGTSGRLLEQHDTARPAAETRGGLIALHEGRFAHLQLRWLYFLLGLAGTGMVGSGLVLWTVKRRVKLPDPDRPYFGFRLVERLNIATIAGLPLAMTAFLWGNRLLPADAGQGSSGDATLAEGTVHGLDRLVAAIGGRAEAEIAVFFGVWALAALYACLRPARRAWIELLAGCAGLLALTPVLNALTSTRGLLPSLRQGDWTFVTMDMGLLALALLMGSLAWRTARFRPKTKPARKAPAAARATTRREAASVTTAGAGKKAETDSRPAPSSAAKAGTGTAVAGTGPEATTTHACTPAGAPES